MELYLRKKQFLAMIGSLLLGILLFGFQNFAFVSANDNEQNAMKKNSSLKCPYDLTEKSAGR